MLRPTCDNAHSSRVRRSSNRSTTMVGRSHGMHAEPITFGLKLLNWLDEVRRSTARRVTPADETPVVATIRGVPPLRTAVQSEMVRENY